MVHESYPMQLLEEIATEAVSDEVNLWPQIALHGQSRLAQWQQTRARRRIIAVAFTAAALFLTAATIPTGMVQRLGLVLWGDGGAPGGATAPGVQVIPPTPLDSSHSLVDAQKLVSFPIRTATWLPVSLALEGVRVAPDGTTIILLYGHDRGPSGMFIQMQPGSMSGGYAIPSSAAETVRINARTGVYAHGSWDPKGNWQSSADSALLSWEANGMTYVLSYSGLRLSRQDLIRVAESVR